MIAALGALVIAAPLAAANQVAVSVQLNVNGGTITSSPAGISCATTDQYDRSQTCVKYFDVGTTIKLSASAKGGDDKVNPPDPGYRFNGWGSSNSTTCNEGYGTATCTFVLQKEAVMTASFTQSTDYNSYPDCLQGTQYNPRWCTDNCANGVVTGSGTQYYSTGGAMYCGGAWQSREMSIGGDKTHSYTLGDKQGKLWPMRACYYRSSSAVWPTAGFSNWSSTLTASNTITKTRHWSWGVYFNTPADSQKVPTSGYGPDCATHDGCVSTSISYGGCPPGTRVGSIAQAEEQVDLARVMRAIVAPRKATTNPKLTVINRRTSKVGTRTITCPKGTVVLHADTATRQPQRREIVEPLVHHTKRSATFTVRKLNKGAVVDLHLVCRASSEGVHVGHDGSVKGGEGDEKIASAQRNQHIMGGAGHDSITARHVGVSVFAGDGDDRVVARANRVVVHGGPGRDTLIGDSSGTTLIEGGSGEDTLIARRGTVRINAEDGKPGDVVICEAGAKGHVRIDKGDIVRGTCAVVRVVS